MLLFGAVCTVHVFPVLSRAVLTGPSMCRMCTCSGELPPPERALWNATGRAFPDLALVGQDISVVFNGHSCLGSGTSAATPMVAAMVALVNDARVAAEMSPLGFMNPLLYSKELREQGVFNDITAGSNPGCGTPGFPASRGWDPVTGLGSLNFANLKLALLKAGGPIGL